MTSFNKKFNKAKIKKLTDNDDIAQYQQDAYNRYKDIEAIKNRFRDKVNIESSGEYRKIDNIIQVFDSLVNDRLDVLERKRKATKPKKKGKPLSYARWNDEFRGGTGNKKGYDGYLKRF